MHNMTIYQKCEGGRELGEGEGRGGGGSRIVKKSNAKEAHEHWKEGRKQKRKEIEKERKRRYYLKKNAFPPLALFWLSEPV